MLARLLPWSGLFLAMLLSACGGDSATPSANSSSEVTGRAAKGILQSARVDAYALENGQRRHLAGALTNDSGDFSLELAGLDQPVLLEVTPAGDGATRMVCDAVDGCGSADFGEAITLSGDFRLTALVAPDELDQGAVAITPLTHMAAEWARSLPRELNAEMMKMARRKVGGLFDLESGFAFQRVPDIAGDALAEEGDQQARRHALIAAAFAEVSADSGKTVPDVLTGFSEAFRQHAGQLQNQGEFSLESLLAGAREIAERRGILTDIREALDGVIAGLNEGVSEVPSQAAFDPEAYDRAMVALDDLDYYLNEAGVDESGTFLADEAHQVNWLFQPEMVGLIESTLKTAMASAMASVMAGVYQDLPGAPTEPLDLSSFIGGSSSNLSALYDLGTQTLTVTGTANGQTHDIVINIDPITSDKSVLNYSIQGTASQNKASIENGTALGELEGNLKVNLYDTDLEPVITALQQSLMGSGDGTDLEQALMDLLPDLHVRGTVTGQGSLVKTGDTDFGFAVNDVSAWGELNMPALQEGGDLLAMEITTGELISPDGDRIAHNPATAAPALAVQVGQHAHLQTDFRAEAFGLPPMRVRADGSLDNIGTLVETVAGELADLDTSSLNVSDLTGLFAGLDYSVLALDGSGQLQIEDPGERGLRTYEFTLEGTRLDASLPNSTEQALSFYLTGLNGGYIYAGDTLVATVTFDWQNLGATLYLVNGEKREYILGPITDIVDPAILDALSDPHGA